MHNSANQDYQIFKDIYEILITGFRKGARKYNTYELLLLTFTIDPISFKLTRHEIDLRLDQLSKKFSRPPIASVNSTLGALEKLQKKNEIELLEWSSKLSCLYILEPAFLFYLRWKKLNGDSTKYEDLLEKLYDIIYIDELFKKSEVQIKFRDEDNQDFKKNDFNL